MNTSTLLLLLLPPGLPPVTVAAGARLKATLGAGPRNVTLRR